MNINKMKEQALANMNWTQSGSSPCCNGMKCEADRAAGGKIRFSFWFRDCYRGPMKVGASLNLEAANAPQETGFFNANDWSGEEINVAYTISPRGDISFELNGYLFELSALVTDKLHGFADFRTLHGSEWSDSLKTFFFTEDEARDAKTSVIKAATYIRNFV